MTTFQHPLQLFTLDYPDDWDVRYQEETGGAIFVHPGDEDASALSLSPVAVTGDVFELREHVVSAAGRMGVELRAEDIAITDQGDTQVGYGEGVSSVEGRPQARYRFWVLRHGALALFGAQLGPGITLESQRRAADDIFASLQFPEVLPPTPEEFRRRVLEVLASEYEQYQAVSEEEWGIRLTTHDGRPAGVIGLENLYRTCLLSPEVAGAMIRTYLQHVLTSFGKHLEEYSSYAAVRERLLPQLKSEQWIRETAGGSSLVYVEFAPGLKMCFAVDEPTRMAYVTEEMLAQWEIPLERLQGVAQDNLAARGENLQVTALNDETGRPCALVVNTQDGYDATRLVLPTIRDVFAEQLGDEYLVGLPNRDFLVAFSQRSPELAAGIIRQIRQDFHQMDHPITSSIYRVKADEIELSDVE